MAQLVESKTGDRSVAKSRITIGGLTALYP